jgi:hypothetical protein
LRCSTTRETSMLMSVRLCVTCANSMDKRIMASQAVAAIAQQ